ncbi:MAG TPA: membrane protein insertion efficiency factor YidD [Mollicutes bacterium]|jgi:putative membrane protein insertion efficiency factor|nr:membrane protein insertion efficiency factor YidD [Mollicutes bacterium]
MKWISILIIKIYQSLPLSSHNCCRFTPTCSHYAIDALNEHGFLKGSLLTSKRILRCGPWSKPGHDPVPPRRKK